MKDKQLLLSVLQHIDKILAYCGGMDYSGFLADEMRMEACVFHLSQIGELTGRFSEAFTNNNASIPWNQLRGLRNRIVHDYAGVNLTLIWQIITEDLPPLREAFAATEQQEN